MAMSRLRFRCNRRLNGDNVDEEEAGGENASSHSSFRPRPLPVTYESCLHRRLSAVLHYASASLQNCTHLANSVIVSEPSGMRYSSSMVAMNGYFSRFISCRISLTCESP